MVLRWTLDLWIAFLVAIHDACSREEVLCVGRSHLASLQPPLPRVAPSRPRPCPSPAWRHTVARSTPRCMPQRSYTVATKTCVDEVHVYHLGDGDGSGKSGADVVLRGHEAEGYGLAWSPMKEGWLLSGSYDKKICLWDLSSGSGAPVLDAQQVFEVMPRWMLLFLFLRLINVLGALYLLSLHFQVIYLQSLDYRVT